MTRGCVTDEQFGQLTRRTGELTRRVNEGAVPLERAMNGLQALIQSSEPVRLSPATDRQIAALEFFVWHAPDILLFAKQSVVFLLRHSDGLTKECGLHLFCKEGRQVAYAVHNMVSTCYNIRFDILLKVLGTTDLSLRSASKDRTGYIWLCREGRGYGQVPRIRANIPEIEAIEQSRGTT